MELCASRVGDLYVPWRRTKHRDRSREASSCLTVWTCSPWARDRCWNSTRPAPRRACCRRRLWRRASAGWPRGTGGTAAAHSVSVDFVIMRLFWPNHSLSALLHGGGGGGSIPLPLTPPPRSARTIDPKLTDVNSRMSSVVCKYSLSQTLNFFRLTDGNYWPTTQN